MRNLGIATLGAALAGCASSSAEISAAAVAGELAKHRERAGGATKRSGLPPGALGEGRPPLSCPNRSCNCFRFRSSEERTAMEPAKPRKWTEEETRLLIELARRKERVPAMARELGRHIASVRRRARELGLLLPLGRGERQL